MHHKRTAVSICAVLVIAAGIGINETGRAQTSQALGIFTGQGSVGETTKGSMATYDPAKGEYRITGGGANMWADKDAFYFVWKKITGDATLQADIDWVGTSPVEHRKAVLIFRQNLDADSAYADAVSHGNGLTSLQFRGAAKEQSYQVFTNLQAPVRLRLVRKGTRFVMYYGKPDDYLSPLGPVEFITLNGEIYVGIGVCSHDITRLDTAIFTNVKLEQGSNY